MRYLLPHYTLFEPDLDAVLYPRHYFTLVPQMLFWCNRLAKGQGPPRCHRRMWSSSIRWFVNQRCTPTSATHNTGRRLGCNNILVRLTICTGTTCSTSDASTSTSINSSSSASFSSSPHYLAHPPHGQSARRIHGSTARSHGSSCRRLCSRTAARSSPHPRTPPTRRGIRARCPHSSRSRSASCSPRSR